MPVIGAYRLEAYVTFCGTPAQAGHRRERAAAYGKLLKLRDTDGFRKQFQ